MTLPTVKQQFVLYISATVCYTVWIYSIESCSCISLSDICLLYVHPTVCGSRPHGNLIFTCEDFWPENDLVAQELTKFDILELKMFG